MNLATAAASLWIGRDSRAIVVTGEVVGVAMMDSDTEDRMVMLSVRMTEDQEHQLKGAAARLGVGQGELMRRFVAQGLAEVARADEEARDARNRNRDVTGIVDQGQS